MKFHYQWNSFNVTEFHYITGILLYYQISVIGFLLHYQSSITFLEICYSDSIALVESQYITGNFHYISRIVCYWDAIHYATLPGLHYITRIPLCYQTFVTLLEFSYQNAIKLLHELYSVTRVQLLDFHYITLAEFHNRIPFCNIIL